MNRLFGRSARLLLVAVVVVLIAAMSTVSAARAATSSANAGSAAGIRTASAHNAASPSAQCTFRSGLTCQSTDATITVSTYVSGPDPQQCTWAWDVNWGDGHTTQNLIQAGPPDGWNLLAQHTYAAPGVYTITLNGGADGPNCTVTDFVLTFTLLQNNSPQPSPTIYWSRTSARPGTLVTLTGNDWVPGGTVKINLPSKGFFIGGSSWKVNSGGGWKQSFRVAAIKPGAYKLRFTESSGGLSVSGHFKVLSVPNAGQDWSRCQDGACTIALDHARTDVLIAILNGTPTGILYYEVGRLCLAYLAPIARYCAIFAAVVVIDKRLLAKQLSDSDQGHGVYITWLTVNVRKLPGITPQK